MFHKQIQQKAAHDQHTQFRKFEISDLVFAKNYFGANKWVPGTVTAIRGPLSYEVTLVDGRVFRRDIDQNYVKELLKLHWIQNKLMTGYQIHSQTSQVSHLNRTQTILPPCDVQHKYVTNLIGLTQLHTKWGRNIGTLNLISTCTFIINITLKMYFPSCY